MLVLVVNIDFNFNSDSINFRKEKRKPMRNIPDAMMKLFISHATKAKRDEILNAVRQIIKQQKELSETA